MDAELRKLLVHGGDLLQIDAIGKRTGQPKLLLKVSGDITVSGTIGYEYELKYVSRWNNSENCSIYGKDAAELAVRLSEGVDRDEIDLVNIGYHNNQRQGVVFEPSRSSSVLTNWQLRRVPVLYLGSEKIRLPHNKLTPVFRSKLINNHSSPFHIENLAMQVGLISKKLAGISLTVREAQAKKIKERAEAATGRKRYTRLTTFKEILRVNEEAAKTYAASITDDAEFTRIVGLVLAAHEAKNRC